MSNLINLIIAFGYLGITLVIFAETGLLIGFFLPGDSLLFTVGLFAAKGDINIWIILPLCLIAAIVGDATGYAFGKRVGHSLYGRKETMFFKKAYIEKTKRYFERHGDKTIVIARFVPIVRTLAPIMAGVGEMPYRHFAKFNILGGVLWVALVLGAGYLLGATIPNIDHYILPIIACIIVISIVPGVVAYFRER